MRRLFRFFKLAFAALILFVLVAQMAIHFGSKPYLYGNAQEVPKAQAVIIPGAAVLRDRSLSTVFRDRVEVAIGLYEAGKASKILVSGDNSTVSYNEVNPVRNFLLARGIPDQDIFLDHAGFDTYSTMYRARAVFGASSVIITTQSFHLPRAVFIARRLGMEAYGLSADREDHPLLARNYFREFFAREKAALDLILRRKPKYLGEPIPITGDARNYP